MRQCHLGQTVDQERRAGIEPNAGLERRKAFSWPPRI